MMAEKTKKERITTRVQLELPPKAMARLRWIKEEEEASSFSEVIKNLLMRRERELLTEAKHKEDIKTE